MNLSEDEQEVLTKDIEAKLYESIPGSKEAFEEYYELRGLLETQPKGRIS